ncbi:MAG: DNA integrity scanning protein DisA nucleotide-binding domain protein [Nanobdellota archaeon]
MKIKTINVPGISFKTAKNVADDVKADCIVSIIDEKASKSDFWLDIELIKDFDDGSEDDSDGDEGFGSYTVQIFKEGRDPIEYSYSKRNNIDKFNQVFADILSDMIKRSYITQDMKVLVVTDQSLTKRYNVAMFVIDVDRVIYRIGKFNLAENMASESIVENIIEMAKEIGFEGREGKKVGTVFVVGDYDELEPYCRQLIMNPFKGYDKELLNIVENSHLKETVKNFAQLDGAFIVDNDGNLRSAGTYLDVDTSNIKPYKGWGTKHLAATAITSETSAIAVLISESGGAVKVFKNGKLILKIR